MSAKTDTNASNWGNRTVAQKGLLTTLDYCYSSGWINDSITLSSFNGDFTEKLVKGGDASDWEYAAMPNSYTLINDSNVSCKQLFKGFYPGGGSNHFDGLFSDKDHKNLAITGKSGFSGGTAQEKATLLENMGFVRASSSTNCVYAKYRGTERSASDNIVGYTNYICEDPGGGSIHTEDTRSWDCNDNASYGLTTCQAPVGFLVENGKTVNIMLSLEPYADTLEYNGNWNSFVDSLKSKLSSKYSEVEDGTIIRWQLSGVDGRREDSFGTDNIGDAEYEISSRRAAADKAIAYLSSNKYSGKADLDFSDAEQLEYYLYNLKEWFFEGVAENEYWQCDIDASYSDFTPIEITSSGSRGNNCGIKTDKASNSNPIYGFTVTVENGVPTYYFDASKGTQLTLPQVITRINLLAENMTDEELDSVAEQQSVVDSNEASDPCYNAGVEGMSWILCPALNNMKYTASLLDNVVEGWLTVEPELYNDDSSTHTVWQVILSITNFIVIIILLAVIFSQLTGVGIDNYGIKKILPKLITTAILINLSFLICDLAVDLSNILGTGLRDMFGSVGELVLSTHERSYPEEFIGTVITAIFAITGVAGAAAPAAIAVVEGAMSGGGVMAVIMIVLALILIIAAILIFFVMLGARMIIIIFCIAVSPLAFACYILPNTKSLFDKWWNIFKAALIVFPICGALGGISYLIKAIVVTTEGVHLWMLIVALIAPYLVFFLLPILLRGAIAAFGKVGAALTTMGNGVRNGLRSGQQAFRNTEAYKENRQEAVRRIQGNRAQRIVNRLSRRASNNGGALSAHDQQRLFRARTILNDRTQERAQAAVGAFTLDAATARSRAEAARDAQEYRAFQDQFADSNSLSNEAATASSWYNPNDSRSRQRMRALIVAMESRGMENDIFGMLRTNPNVGSDVVAMNALASSNNKVLKAYGKKGAGMSYEQFMKSGRMAQYVGDKGSDFLDGLDDKALAEVNRYSNNGNQIMDNDLLVSAATRINSQDAVNQIEAMLNKRSGIQFSAGQLAQFNSSTISRLVSRGASDPQVAKALVDASNDIAANPKLLSSLSSPNRQQINNFRATMGLPPI